MRAARATGTVKLKSPLVADFFFSASRNRRAMRTLKQVTSAALSLAPPQVLKGGTKVANVTAGDAPLEFLMYAVKIPFAPSVFGGGESDRQSLCLSLTDDSLLKQLDHNLCDAALSTYTGYEWRTSLTPAGQYDACLKAKITRSRAKYFSSEGDEIPEPSEFRGLECNAALRVSLWMQKATVGATYSLTALQIVKSAAPANPFSL
jgi:hypothetical protein